MTRIETPVITVTGATGNVGRPLIRLLVQAGLRPRVVVRDPDRLGDLADAVEPVVGTLDDRDLLVEAFAGADACYLVLPEDFTADDPLAQTKGYADALAGAVREAAPARVVLQSSGGAELREGVGMIDANAHAEVLLDRWTEETGGAVLHLRCGFFMTNLLMSLDAVRAGEITVIDDPDEPRPWVDPADIAAVAAVNLLSDWSGRRVQAVHGPTDLSWNDAAGILSEELGRDVTVRRIDDEERLAELTGAGLSPAAAQGLVGMSVGQRGQAPEQERSPTSTTPSTLARWARAVLRPAVAAAS